MIIDNIKVNTMVEADCSQFLVEIQQDPVDLFLRPVVDEKAKKELHVKVSEALKPKIKFDLTSLA